MTPGNPEPALSLIHPFPEWAGRVRAAFSTRPGGASTGAYASLNLGFRSGDDRDRVEGNWSLALRAAGMPAGPIVLPKMTHGDRLVEAPAGVTSRLPGSGFALIEPEAADALIARAPGSILAVTMADCLAALIFDPASGVAAAVHAGWRGTCYGILRKTLAALIERAGLRPETALVAFGPCLRRESLQVGPEVAAQLRPDFVSKSGGRYYFDMPADNRAQALACGILPENLRDMGGDSLRESDRYFSYRRDGQASGRMAAFICLI